MNAPTAQLFSSTAPPLTVPLLPILATDGRLTTPLESGPFGEFPLTMDSLICLEVLHPQDYSTAATGYTYENQGVLACLVSPHGLPADPNGLPLNRPLVGVIDVLPVEAASITVPQELPEELVATVILNYGAHLVSVQLWLNKCQHERLEMFAMPIEELVTATFHPGRLRLQPGGYRFVAGEK